MSIGDSPPIGDLKLVETLANYYGKQIGRTIDPKTEVTVSVGATEGLFAIMQSFLNEGDEVIVLEPAFDIYPAQIQMSGGVTKMVPLRLNPETKQWFLDMAELEATITPKTKLIILNTPNPTSKVFTRELGDVLITVAYWPLVGCERGFSWVLRGAIFLAAKAVGPSDHPSHQ